MGLKVIGLLGVVYLNVKKNFLTKAEGHIFLEDDIDHGYSISRKMVEDILDELK